MEEFEVIYANEIEKDSENLRVKFDELLKEIAEKSQAIDQELRDKQTETLQVDKLL